MQLKTTQLMKENFEQLLNDYPEVERLLAFLNLLNTQLTQILNGGIRFTDNVKCVVKDVTFEQNQTFPLKVQSGLSEKVRGVITLKTDTVNGTAGPFEVDWTPSDDGIAITATPGRPKGRHTVRLLMVT